MTPDEAMEPDEVLIAAFLDGDETAFERIVERYEARVRKLAFGFVRDRHLAEDIAQEAFLQVYQKVSTLGRIGAFRSWLYRIVINRAHDELRRMARTSEMPAEEMEEGLRRSREPVAVDRLVESRELGRKLSAAIGELPEKHRTPLILKEVQGMTYAEIGELLGWPIGTVQIRIHRARLQLRSRLRDLEVRVRRNHEV